MNDSNLGTEQTSRPCTNQNFIHPLQRNGDVLSDRRELAGGSSTSVEFLFSPVHVEMGVQQNSENVIQINGY